MERESLQHAREALDQGRIEDSVAFLRETIREARAENDGESLAAAGDLARRIPDDAAAELLAELEGEVGTPKPEQPAEGRQLGKVVFLLVVLAIVAGTQLVPRMLSSDIPDAAYEGEELPGTRTLTADGVYLVPLGRLDTVDSEDVAEYLRRTYDLRVEVLPRLPLERWAFDEEREQLDADALMRLLFLDYRAFGSRQLVVGLTDYDMYLRANPDFRFVFSSRGLRDGYSVVSTARMGPDVLDRLLLRDPTEARARKMIERQVGFVLFDLPPTLEESSPMRSEIRGTGDIDEIEQPLPFVPGVP